MLSTSCAHQPARPSSKVVLSLQNIDCEACGEEVTEAIKREPGFLGATFDRDKAELTVSYDPAEVTPQRLLAASRMAGRQVVVGAGHGSYQPDAKFPPDLDVKWLSTNGGDVELSEHLAGGKVTVFDFYAPWCGPCREVDKEMLKLLKASPDLALRKLNVVEWDTPLVKHYRMASLPYTVVYSKKGKLVRKITGLDLKRLNQAIEKGRVE